MQILVLIAVTMQTLASIVVTMQTLSSKVVTMQTCFAGSCLFASFPNIIGLYQRLAQPDILLLLTICYWQFDASTCNAVGEIGTNAVLYRVG